MTTTTMNALNVHSLRPAHAFKIPAHVQNRATLGELPAEQSLFARTLEIVSQAALAAVPFVAIGWMFLAH